MNTPAIKIEKGIPISPKHHPDSECDALREAISRMKPNESFLYPSNKPLYRVAASLGITIVTRKQNGTGYRVWRMP
jgi:hypothetical protein